VVVYFNDDILLLKYKLDEACGYVVRTILFVPLLSIILNPEKYEEK